jgi:hypothetical protein
MNKEERRKNETLPNVPSHGYSPVPCLRLSLAEIRLRLRDAAALEITKLRLKETTNGNTKEKTQT